MSARFSRRLWPRAAGLTLIEILVTLAVLGLALMLLGNGLRLTFSAQGRISAAAQVLEERHAALERLRALALRAAPLVLRRGDGRLTLAFVGSADRLVWGVDGLAEAARPGLHAAALRVEAGALILHHPELNLSGDAGARSRLLPGVTALRFAYFGPRNGSGAPVWQDEWPAQERAPYLLRITLAFADGSPSQGISLPLGTLDTTPLDALALSAEMTRQFDALAAALGLNAEARL